MSPTLLKVLLLHAQDRRWALEVYRLGDTLHDPLVKWGSPLKMVKYRRATTRGFFRKGTF